MNNMDLEKTPAGEPDELDIILRKAILESQITTSQERIATSQERIDALERKLAELKPAYLRARKALEGPARG
jgi:polyhydroxyalkanoate synthesis regulator phasin